ncbi:hypothetical protein CEUSTIGMA_g5397.t1 [Chlamydomonas eustigma]|uniref:J domain-containing protein n=1 Tax=Chlamydomonas eustigma TaxID=1157962 RepID=A0A250X4F7_9CHLO|nr:hypothetical protein CEUSTIGMA_g5397.t1 [Chlamydomonas eustigma]|eukprot:GAX77955.1 hypothetical protein CEUSTIGMA_g5397.t1 [Chlamydomonas eustigma]
MVLSRKSALKILGLPEYASPYDIRKAFKLLALNYHPDKVSRYENSHNEGGLALQDKTFQQIAEAYYVLSNWRDDGQIENSSMMDSAGEDGLCEVLAAEFYEEAFAQSASAFDMMYIQERLRGQLSSSWASCDTEAGSEDHMWRKIHRAVKQRRERQREGLGSSEGALPALGPYLGTRHQKWGLIADFMLDLVKLEDEAFVRVDRAGHELSGHERQSETRQGPDDANEDDMVSTASCTTDMKESESAGRKSCGGSSKVLNTASEEAMKCTSKNVLPLRRTTWKFYLTWARRIVVIKAVLALLWS